MEIHVPACSTIQLSTLRQIKFILVHPSGNVQLAFRNSHIFSYPIGAFGISRVTSPVPLTVILSVYLQSYINQTIW